MLNSQSPIRCEFSVWLPRLDIYTQFCSEFFCRSRFLRCLLHARIFSRYQTSEDDCVVAFLRVILTRIFTVLVEGLFDVFVYFARTNTKRQQMLLIKANVCM